METTIYSELSSRIAECSKQISGVVRHTPLHPVPRLSEKYEADIWFKRDDQQVVRSYKIRGAYNTMVNLDDESRAEGVGGSSAGNNAQGVAYSCQLMKIRGRILMTKVPPRQKLANVRSFRGERGPVGLVGQMGRASVW